MRQFCLSSGIRPAVRSSRTIRAVVLLLLSGQIATGVPSGASAAEKTPIERQAHGVSVAAAIAEASQRFAVPEHWLRAIMRIESRGHLRAKSRKGAMGLMQIMPATWAGLRARYGFGSDPYDAHENILAGAAYVREMHDRYGAPGFLAAYNAGPGRYEQFLSTGRSLPAETQNYVTTLAPIIGGGDANWLASGIAKLVSWTHAPLFAGHADSAATISRLAADRPRDRRPNTRAVVDVSAIVPRSDGLFPQRTRPEGVQ
jgi:hypothetical protein